MEYLIGIIIGVGLGVVAVWLRHKAAAAEVARTQAEMSQQVQQARMDAQQQAAEARSALEQNLAAAEAKLQSLGQQLDELQKTHHTTQAELTAVAAAKVKAETQLDETAKSLTEQKKQFEQARQQLTESFKSLSGEALKSNNEQFLTLAKKTFEATIAEAKGDIGKKQQAVDALVKPMAETLKRYEQQVRELEQTRQKAYVSLQEQVKSLTASQQDLRKETGNLVSALRRPQVRGRWGEVTLRRVVELAGMSEHCDFNEQVTVEEQRPDMVVHLPAGRQIVVDSKVALDGYLQAVEAPDDEHRAAQLQRHARQMREHMKQLAGKSYWDKFDASPEFVVMFIPGDSFLAAALDKDHSLIEDGMENKVVLATPTTLIAVLRAVAYGWRQERMADNARQISDLGKDLYERIKVMASHVVTLGRSINKSSDSFNKVVGSLETRVLPSARRFKELGATGTEEIPTLEPVETQTRPLTATELTDSPNDAK